MIGGLDRRRPVTSTRTTHVHGAVSSRDHDARLTTVLDALSAIGDHRFDVRLGLHAQHGWRPASIFADPTSGALLDGAARYLDCRGASSERVAASILTQVYANRLVGIGIGCWVTGRIVPVLSPHQVLLRFDGPRPIATALRSARVAGGGREALGVLGEELFAGHLAGVVAGVGARSRLSGRRLWGNVAASCATVFTLLHRSSPVHQRDDVRADASAFLAVPEWPVHGLIDWHDDTVGGAPLRYRRRTCCLYRQIPGKEPCSTCSLPLPALAT